MGEEDTMENASISAAFMNGSATNIFGEEHDWQFAIYVISIAVPTIIGMIFIVGIIGNLLLIFTVLRNKVMRTNPNIFLVSLSIGDAILLLISAPYVATIFTLPEWTFGEAMCKINEFVQTLSLGVSIFTLTAVSGDRFIAIVFPIVSYKWSTMRRTLQICSALWVFSFVLAVPDLVTANVDYYNDTDKPFLVCRLAPEEWGSEYSKGRTMFRFVVYFLAPILVISVMYVMIAKTLLHKPLDTDPGRTTRNMNAAWAKQMYTRKKVSNMVLCIVVLFVICWLPRHIYLLWHWFYPESLYTMSIHIFKIFGYCLSFAYSCVNPVALYVISNDFRQYFDHYLFGCCCKSRRMKLRRRAGSTDTGFAHSMISNGGRLVSGSRTVLSLTPGNTPNISLEDLTRVL